MADLFGGDFMEQPAQQEVDPAAEFLAQQENEIAGLESDVLGGFENVEEPTLNGFADGNIAGDVPPDSNDDFFNVPDVTENEPPLVNGGGDFENGDLEERMDPSQAYAAIAAADARLEQLRAEPDQIRIWREENTKLLAEKDRESERKQQEWLAQARKELEDWERNRQEQLEKTKESNRLANEAFLQQRDGKAIGYTTAEDQFTKERDQNTPGSEWERVSKLCDFNPKISKGSKDVTRMRSTLLHLKQNPRPVSVPEVGGD